MSRHYPPRSERSAWIKWHRCRYIWHNLHLHVWGGISKLQPRKPQREATLQIVVSKRPTAYSHKMIKIWLFSSFPQICYFISLRKSISRNKNIYLFQTKISISTSWTAWRPWSAGGACWGGRQWPRRAPGWSPSSPSQGRGSRPASSDPSPARGRRGENYANVRYGCNCTSMKQDECPRLGLKSS